MKKAKQMLIWSAALILLLIVVPAVLIQRSQSASAAAQLKEGDRAPDFSLPDQNGRTVRLADYLGQKTVVLAFYIKAGTPG